MAHRALLLQVSAALLSLAATWLLIRALVRLVWRPRAMAARFRAQGVRGPPYRFLRGSLDEMRRMKAEGDKLALDVRDHDILPRILPHFAKWKDQYGMAQFSCTSSCRQASSVPEMIAYALSLPCSGLFI